MLSVEKRGVSPGLVGSYWLVAMLLTNSPALSLGVEPAKPDARADNHHPLVMHEWGTFTTFSGSDGIHLDFRPLDVDHADLPSFVMDRSQLGLPRPGTTNSAWPSGLNGGPFVLYKSRIRARVRMETPVIYFYTDVPRSVNVRVAFPEGLVTEFYPPVRSQLPKFDAKVAFAQGEPVGGGAVDWGQVDLLPPSLFRPALPDASLFDDIAETMIARMLPDSSAYPHYAHARKTDSALVHVRLAHPPVDGSPAIEGESHLERFLFYRGVGKFRLPFQVRYDQHEQGVWVNDSDEALPPALMIQIDGEQCRMGVLGAAAPHSTTSLPELAEVKKDEIERKMQQLLEDADLYPKEAAAMVDTWKDSWFTEEGTRVLYFVPRPLVDQLLPLTIEPAPAKAVRVLVGRLELMSPSMEAKIRDVVRLNIKARAEHSRQIDLARKAGKDTSFPLPLPAAVVSLGRFAEPAIARVIATTADRDVENEAKVLLAEIRSRNRALNADSQASAQN